MNTARGPLYSIVLFLFVFVFISPLRLPIRTFSVNKHFKLLFPSVIALLFLAPIFLIFKFNVNFNTLFFKEIYETRALFGDKIKGIYDYFYNWEVKILIPILLVFYLIDKKYILGLFAFLILIYLFIISGNKSVYMASMVTIFFYLIGDQSYILKVKLFLFFLLISLIILPIVDIYILNDFLLRGIFVMRMFFFPALLNHYYFDFFADAPLYFSESHFLGLFPESPYEINSAVLISRVYFHTNEMYANNGIISDGFMNLGYWGVLIFSTLFAIIFMILNSINIDARYFGIFFILVFFFLSIPFFTILLTGGIWLLLLLSVFLMKKIEQ